MSATEKTPFRRKTYRARDRETGIGTPTQRGSLGQMYANGVIAKSVFTISRERG